MGLIQEETGGGSGYDHPSPSIPLPVEGRGKPVAMRPERLDVLAASVTYCKTRHLHNVFLKSDQVFSKSLDGDGIGKLGCPGCQSRRARRSAQRFQDGLFHGVKKCYYGGFPKVSG